MSARTLAEGRARWEELVAFAAGLGLTHAELCRVVAQTRGRFQIVEQLSDEQHDWARRECERVAKGKDGGEPSSPGQEGGG